MFSKIQELFSFQQDVAATKKNPMCWLRRAEAEQNIETGVPLGPKKTHGKMKVFVFIPRNMGYNVITPKKSGFHVGF